jgi:hypothetical protein
MRRLRFIVLVFTDAHILGLHVEWERGVAKT